MFRQWYDIMNQDIKDLAIAAAEMRNVMTAQFEENTFVDRSLVRLLNKLQLDAEFSNGDMVVTDLKSPSILDYMDQVEARI